MYGLCFDSHNIFPKINWNNLISDENGFRTVGQMSTDLVYRRRPDDQLPTLVEDTTGDEEMFWATIEFLPLQIVLLSNCLPIL